MEKLLISSKLFVSLMSTINLTSLRLDNFIQLWGTSSIIIGLELVFLNLCSTISENLIFLSFQKNPDLLIFWVATWDFLWPSKLANQTYQQVSPFLHDRQTMTDLTNFLQESDKLVYGPVVLLAPEWTAVKRALCQWCRHWSPSHAGSRAWCRLRTPGWKFQWSLTCERSVVDQSVRLLIHGSAKGIYLRTDPHRRWRGRSGGWSRRWERLWRVQSGESQRYRTHMRLTHGWNDAH